MVASNTKDCFRECIGKHIKGVIFDALPINSNCSTGTKTLIFEDSSGLTISSHGTFWLEDPKTIQDAIKYRRIELEKTKLDIEEILSLTGF